MSDVLGTNSFLDTPDVNGTLVLLETNPVMNGVGSVTLPTGTTAQRPGSPTVGMLRFNTTIGSTEYYTGTVWIPAGSIVQTIIGDIPTGSSNSQIPYDNSVPQSNEGYQIWSRSFTPILSDSLIVITSSGFYSVNNAADIIATLATFNDTTCFSAALVGFSTSTGEGRGFSIISTQISGSTSARTYSARIGPNVNQTLYINRNAGSANLYGGAVNIGTYIIQEIAL